MSISLQTQPQIALAGEALIDLISHQKGDYKPCLGGAVYNLTRALSRQGIPTAYLNPLSSDDFGRALYQQLVDDKVVVAQPVPIQAVTSLAIVNLNEDGHPSYAFYREGVADRATDASTLNQLCDTWRDLDLICTGALALDPRDESVYFPWLEQQHRAGKFMVIDANLRPSVMPDINTYRQHLWKMLNLAHLIKVSDEDLRYLDVAGSTPIAQAQSLLQSTQASVIALTMGQGGAALICRRLGLWSAAEKAPIQVVDTVGAGDSFLAGLLASLLKQAGPSIRLLDFFQTWQQAQLELALSHAVASASLCVQIQGCQPPSFEQAMRWRAAHPI